MIDQEATELLRHMEHWGYDLADPPHPRSPGYGRLLVAIRRTPTEDHYDPEAIQLHLCSAQGPPARTTIHLDTSLDGPARVSAGHVELTDRFNKRRGFFTYGASIDMGSQPDEAVFDLRSPAPIVELTGTLDEDVGQQLASGTEALWAKVHVRWGVDDTGLMRCLGSAEPEMLYASTLVSLWDMYRESHILRQTFPRFYNMLRREMEWAESRGLAMANVRPLDEFVCP